VDLYLAHPNEWTERKKSAEKILATLQNASLGMQCQTLEQLSQSIEANEDTGAAWQNELSLLMRTCETLFIEDPKNAARIGRGLIHAWHLSHTNLSPRLALEWAAVASSLNENISVPSFLQPTYL